MDPDLEIVCFDCEHGVVAVMGGEREALYLAGEHSDSTGHRLVVQRYSGGRATQLWQVSPHHCVEV